MIFSCLVDADFKDTEQFYARIDGRQIDRDWPALQSILPELINAFDMHMNEKQSVETALNRLRAEILGHVRSHAGDPPGLFTLTVPTGGGKTLASLGFALNHAKAHGHERIIYAIPFTAIIDQTAAIFREVLGGDIILEHHSAIEEEEDERRASAPRDADSTKADRDKLKLAMEDWAAPVVVTTNVQLFESLFAARTSRSRKLHNIAGSIIILDEAQTLPRPLLAPCAQALDELARNYRCSIVLCTATQPALDAEKFNVARLGAPPHPAGLPLAGRELAPHPARLSEQLERIRLAHEGDMDDAALVAALARTEQALVIVNTRKHALALYRAARAGKCALDLAWRPSLLLGLVPQDHASSAGTQSTREPAHFFRRHLRRHIRIGTLVGSLGHWSLRWLGLGSVRLLQQPHGAAPGHPGTCESPVLLMLLVGLTGLWLSPRRYKRG